MLQILKYFGFKIENTEEYKLLKLQNEILLQAVKVGQDQYSTLSREHQKLRERWSASSRQEEAALQKLIDELDIMVLEAMEPVGDA